MKGKKLQALANHDGHNLTVAEYDDKVNVECLTCQEIILVLEENENGDLTIKKQEEQAD